MLRILTATAVAGFLLFAWGGLTQMFPWGPSSAHVVTTETDPALGDFHLRAPLVAEPGSLATEAFDTAFAGRTGLLFTDNTISWISSMPLDYYNGTAYLTRQAGTQVLIGAFLVVLLMLLAPLGRSRSMAIVALGGTAASVATYGVLANWWGLAPGYALGESANLIAGWVIAALAASWILQANARLPQSGMSHGS